jgi:hypothetical protein
MSKFTKPETGFVSKGIRIAAPTNPKLVGKQAPPSAPKPSAPRSEEPEPSRPSHPLGGLRNWTERIEGCPLSPERISNIVIYLLDVAKNPYYQKNLSRRFVRSQWARLNDEVPEEYEWEPDPMIVTYTAHQGDGKTEEVSKIVRRPRNTKERAVLQMNVEHNIQWLYDPQCKYGCEYGNLFVSDFPDAVVPAQRRIGHSVTCRCVYE